MTHGRYRRNIRFPRAAGVSYTVPDLCRSYTFPTGITGPDMVIGIIELGGGYRASDVTAAFAKWNLPAPSLTDVSVDGGRNAPGDPADVEVLLDIQVAGAAYSFCTGRAAHIRTYFAPNTDQGFIDAVAQAGRDGCAAISISWGGPESSWGKAACQAFDQACASAVASGSTIFAASGDNDSGDGLRRGVAVDFPASSPHVVGCGGTTKPLTAPEAVWNDGQNGTGGGYSIYFAPQSWQVGTPSLPGRMVPDLAACADPATGYQIVVNGATQVVGGTSAVAPLYAGLMAALASAKGTPLGNILPLLYTNPAAFTDITAGNNGQYRAQQGPDPCTGLGTPIGIAVMRALVPVVPPPVNPPPVNPPPTGAIKATVSYDPIGGWSITPQGVLQ